MLLRYLIDTDACTPKILGAICQKFRVSELTVQGDYGAMHGPAVDAYLMPEYMETGAWDRPQVSYLRDALRHGGTFIDIGANIGMYTVALAANPKVECIAFEPEPTNFRMLQTNIVRNCPHANVTCHQAAIMETPGTVLFELSPENMGDHRIRSATGAPAMLGEENRATITVRGERLDEMLAAVALRPPTAMKIDVQGAELAALRSAGGLLAVIDIMLIEFWPYGIRRMGGDPKRLLGLLRPHFTDAVYVPAGHRFRGDSPSPIDQVFSALEPVINSPNPREFGDLLLTNLRSET